MSGERSQKKKRPTLAIRKSQIKTTLRLHFTTVKMAKIKKKTKDKCSRGCGRGETLTHRRWECQLQPLWTSVQRSCKEAKNESTILQRYATFGLIPKDAISSRPLRYLLIHIHAVLHLCFHILTIKVWNSSSKMWGMLPYFLDLDLTAWLALSSGILDATHEG